MSSTKYRDKSKPLTWFPALVSMWLHLWLLLQPHMSCWLLLCCMMLQSCLLSVIHRLTSSTSCHWVSQAGNMVWVACLPSGGYSDLRIEPISLRSGTAGGLPPGHRGSSSTSGIFSVASVRLLSRLPPDALFAIAHFFGFYT